MMRKNIKIYLFIAMLVLAQGLLPARTAAQQPSKAVIAYYAGSAEALDSFDMCNITHLIYCFGHLKGNEFKLDSRADTVLMRKMVALKKKNLQLKVLVSLGGWGGCETCSPVFSTRQGRSAFARSVDRAIRYFGADGIDLDWEYPTIAGYPGHPFAPGDKAAFTALLQELRNTLGTRRVITFAAGGFQHYLDNAVDWTAAMKYVDYVNLMTYDFVSGAATTTGHHTALYSTTSQKESTDNCVKALVKIGVSPQKLIIGAAFYARTWNGVSAANKGLYQSGTFKDFIGYNEFSQRLARDSGYVFYWDTIAQAPYVYNETKQTFATFDDKQSVRLKTEYVLANNLGGIMFWELRHDTAADGLLHQINTTLKQSVKKEN
jgi:chitinase